MRRDKSGWTMLALLCAAYFLHQADRAIFGVVLPLIRADLSLSDTELGAIATATFAVIALLVPVAGPLADHLSRKFLVASSLLFWSVATSLTGLAGGVASLLTWRGLATGGGEALYTPAAYSLIDEHYAQRKGFALALHQTALYAGLIASGVVGGYVGEAFGWRTVFLLFGGAGILLGLYMSRRLAPDRRHSVGPAPAAILRAVRHFFTEPAALLLSGTFGCYMFVTNAYLVWAPEFLGRAFGLGVGAAGSIAMIVHHAAAGLGVVGGGLFSDRLARRNTASRALVQAGALALAAPFLLLMAKSGSLLSACAGIALFGLFRGGYDSGIQASLFEVISADERGTAWSLMVLIGFLIGSASPVISGFLMQRHGWGLSAIFAGCAGVYGLGALLLLGAWACMPHTGRFNR